MEITEIILVLFIAIIATFAIPLFRRFVLTGPIFRIAKRVAPKISPIERQAIEAGSDGFDAELFSGRPNWNAFRAINPIILTKEERAFLDGPTREFCARINDWHIRGEQRDVTDDVWNFAKKHGFLGLRVSKKAGGHGFSAQAQSIILGMIASRSIDASTTVEVPNSLGPDELLEQYGTQEQKEKYLKALVIGKEIACFAITSPAAGSDAASMRDVGYIGYGTFEGKKTLGITLSWFKRYITLAPRATVIVLAFRLFDPEKLLKGNEDRGITLALIPASHPGVHIGRRYIPGGAVFPNGPVSGENVFIPLEWVLGGKAGIGNGWKMTMQCLAAGRGISLPSMSTAAVKLTFLTSTAYARIRRQFNKPIGKIEGVEEPLARLAESAYLTEAGRAVTSAMVSRETRPLVIASIMKYQMTEYARRAINDAMDIHGGKGIIDGPSNYLQSMYQIAPVAITVEGANIITRSLIVVGQAVLRSHPYFKRELEALESPDSVRGLKDFDKAFSSHMIFFASNFLMTLFHNTTGGMLANTSNGPARTKPWYRRLSHASKRFAFLADAIIITYKGQLKKKQKISGRLADALSELYLLSCVLKRFEDDGAHESDYPIVKLCMLNGLYRFESALNSLINNISIVPLRLLLRIVVGQWVGSRKPAPDSLGTIVVSLVLKPSEVRDRLARYVYIPNNITDPIGLLEETFRKSVETEPIMVKVEQAIRSGGLKRFHGIDWIHDAKRQGIITGDEVKKLMEIEQLVERSTAVDHFDPAQIRGIAHGG